MATEWATYPTRCSNISMVLSVLAVVPTYRPDVVVLSELLQVLRMSGIRVIVVDDASPCTFDRTLRQVREAGTPAIRLARNRGIARSLNIGLRRAVELEMKWLLTVDQDSAVSVQAVAEQAKILECHPQVGVAGVEIVQTMDAELRYPTYQNGDLVCTEEVFQSGSLWRVSALQRIRGFDEVLRIDAVDAAACLNLRQLGFLVAVAPATRIQHQYGSGRSLRVLGKLLVATGHSPSRRESMIRNRLNLFPSEFRQSPRHALRTIRRVGVNGLLGALVEERRLANLQGTLRGLASVRWTRPPPPGTYHSVLDNDENGS